MDINLKRGQMKLSFGMIFSIFLIIIFLTFAFYAITKFMDNANVAQAGKFVSNLQNDIDKMWKGSQGSETISYSLPSKIKYVCFIDYGSETSGPYNEYYNSLSSSYFGSENLFFYPAGSASGFDSVKIEHINLENIISSQNPFCIQNKEGKVEIRINKNYNENLINLS